MVDGEDFRGLSINHQLSTFQGGRTITNAFRQLLATHTDNYETLYESILLFTSPGSQKQAEKTGANGFQNRKTNRHKITPAGVRSTFGRHWPAGLQSPVVPLKKFRLNP